MPKLFEFIDGPHLPAIDFLRPDEYEEMKRVRPDEFEREIAKLKIESVNPERMPAERETCLQILKVHINSVTPQFQ